VRKVMKSPRRRMKGTRRDEATLWIHAWRCAAAESKACWVRWVPEYKFRVGRRWAFDWTLPELKIAVEVDGGRFEYAGGKHGSDADREKMNAAVEDGWRVFRYSPQQLKNDPLACVDQVAKFALCAGVER